jgi:hypothetical protein
MNFLVKKLAYMIILVVAFAQVANSAELKNLRVMHVETQKDYVRLKLQDPSGPKEMYFYVDLMKDDKALFEKYNHVLNKIFKKNRYQFGLDIISFSHFPKGAVYKSYDVKFSGQYLTGD